MLHYPISVFLFYLNVSSVICLLLIVIINLFDTCDPLQGCPQKKKVEWYFYNKIYKINKTTRWEVVKNSASPKRPFFFFFFLDFVSFFPFLYHFQVQIVTKHAFSSIFGCFWSLDQAEMQDSQVQFCYWKSFHGGRHPWLGFFFFFFFFFVGKVVRYNTALARFRDNPAL